MVYQRIGKKHYLKLLSLIQACIRFVKRRIFANTFHIWVLSQIIGFMPRHNVCVCVRVCVRACVLYSVFIPN